MTWYMNVIILQEVTAASTPYLEASGKQTKRDKINIIHPYSSFRPRTFSFADITPKQLKTLTAFARKLPQRSNSQQPWSRFDKFKSASSKQKLLRIFCLTLMLNDMVLYMSTIKKLLHLRNLPLRVEANQVHKLQMIGFV